MSDDTDRDPRDRQPDKARSQGFSGSDIVAVLAMSSFLAAIGLTTFFLTTALAH